MKILIVGSGIAGMSAAIEAASLGLSVTMVSPFVAERAQSVMAAGGINAVLDPARDGDSVESHVQDTWKGGCEVEKNLDLQALCGFAAEHIRFLESLGVVFNRYEKGRICQRAFGGLSHIRTAYSGSSTGKQIVTGLVQKCREYEALGLLERVVGPCFHSALIRDGRCYGALFLNSRTGEITPMYADAVIMATGGQNKLFGKTTGTENCDGYAASRLMFQGVVMRNLEFIQYHPTTIETSHKRMLITEAARGEGGRLYYLREDGQRCYFMEEQFGEKGNLMPRDVVSKCMYDCPSQVYLDVTFLGRKVILSRLREVYDLCLEYLNLDVTKESIPVAPSVHFFMGGIAVNAQHETNVQGLYAVGECASMYHGANRLGGNSLLAAVHSGRTAARACAAAGDGADSCSDAASGTGAGAGAEVLFNPYVEQVRSDMAALLASQSRYPAAYMLQELAEIMNRDLGITRCEADLQRGLEEVDQNLEYLTALH